MYLVVVVSRLGLSFLSGLYVGVFTVPAPRPRLDNFHIIEMIIECPSHASVVSLL